MNEKTTPPTLPAYDTGRQYVVWCASCRRWHLHSRENGHRVAHCHSDRSPYQAGYILRCIGPAPADVLRDFERRRPRGPQIHVA